MLTFEFPTVPKADYFVARLQREGHDYSLSPSGRVVDVHLPTSDDPIVTAITSDYLVMLAKHFGAHDIPKGLDRLYTLYMWGDKESPKDTIVSVTTLSAFLRANPYLATECNAAIDAHGFYKGGGGAAPHFRLTRTVFVGREG